MSRAESIREKVRSDRREYRLEKLDSHARRTAWNRIAAKVKAAFDAENKARDAMEERSDEETRRRYLAAKMHRMNLVNQSNVIWG